MMAFTKRLLAVAAFAISSLAIAQPIGGTPEAAIKIGSEFLQLILGVAPGEVKVGTTSFNDNAASLQLRASGSVCDLELLKNASANKYGWVVQLHTCKKEK